MKMNSENTHGYIALYEKLKQEYKNTFLVRVIVWFVVICGFVSLYSIHIHPHTKEAISAVKAYNSKRVNTSKNYNLSIDMLSVIHDIMEKSIAEVGGDYMLYLDYHNSGAGILGHKGFSHVKTSLQLVQVRDENLPFINFYDFLYDIPARKLDILYSTELQNKSILYIGDLPTCEYYYFTRNLLKPYKIHTICVRELMYIGEKSVIHYGCILVLSKKINDKIDKKALEKMTVRINRRVHNLLNDYNIED